MHMKIIKLIPPVSLMDMPMMDTSAVTRKCINIDYTPAALHRVKKTAQTWKIISFAGITGTEESSNE